MSLEASANQQHMHTWKADVIPVKEGIEAVVDV